mgnify:CR=1 FL=1
MRAAVLREHGGPEVLTIENVPDPTAFKLRQLSDDYFGLLNCQPDAAVRALLG